MRMKRTLLVAGLLLASATAAAAELTLFSDDNFAGQRLQANDAIPNLANSGFNDRASSVVDPRRRLATVRRRVYPRTVRHAATGALSVAARNWPERSRFVGARDGQLGKAAGAAGTDGQWGGRSRAVLFSEPGLPRRALRR